jgi:hypothetical protein
VRKKASTEAEKTMNVTEKRREKFEVKRLRPRIKKRKKYINNKSG